MENIINIRNKLNKDQSISNKEIITEYLRFCSTNTTFRSICEKDNHIKTFGIKDRIGLHENPKSNRKEEIVCQAMYNSYSKEIISLRNFSQKVVDYQTPLKNNDKDNKWGKIDLASLIIGSSKKELCFWEVKIGNQDSIKYAILELLIYFSQFDFKNSGSDFAKLNYRNYIRELYLSRNIKINNNIIEFRDKLPILFVAGDDEYFKIQKFDNHTNDIQKLINEINNELSINIYIIQIGNKTRFNSKKNKHFCDNNIFKLLIG